MADIDLTYRKENIRKSGREFWKRLRTIVIDAYGGKCACCGEAEPMFLTLDHIGNNGADDRKKRGNAVMLFRWLKENNFPDGYQVLCYNCNCAKGFYGRCPHEGNVLDNQDAPAKLGRRKSSPAIDPRLEGMIELRKQGMGLADIGSVYGIGREMVGRILGPSEHLLPDGKRRVRSKNK